MNDVIDPDWAYCQEALNRVSRTFSQPIRMLPPDLGRAVTCGYLLCRLVDTIEDDAALPLPLRDRLYAAFLDVVERRAGPESLAALALEAFPPERPTGPGLAKLDEVALFHELPAIWRVLHTTPRAMVEGVLPWVAEMGRGMAIYSHRARGEDGVQALLTAGDLERYCFFVAGTVGHMLTALFTAALPGLAPDRHRALLNHTEDFALGLQLTNILKDVAEDLERGVSFIPRTAFAEAGLDGPRDLRSPRYTAAFRAAVAPTFARARAALDGALSYTLALPPEATGLRLFCVLPLVMAVRTLTVAEASDSSAPPKISRDEVYRLIDRALREVGDDDALTRWVEELKRP